MAAHGTRFRTAQELSYRTLLQRLDHWFDAGVQSALPVVVPCRSGCTRCCHGPFDISSADAQLVAQAVSCLPDSVRTEVIARAEQQLREGSRASTAWVAPWRVASLSEEAVDAMCDALAEQPCPALDPETGACLIHADRPATCRLMGLSLRTPEGDQLDNLCPIQQEFGGYAELAPTLFDLMEFELDAAHADLDALGAGWHATTVAGAITAQRSDPASPKG